jgi:predicted HAD superfamily phosphohydrolase YqeG
VFNLGTSGLTKIDVGLTNVDNTTDLSKPISTLTQSAINLKADLLSPTFTGIVSGIDKTMVGLTNVDNTTDLSKPISTLTQAQLDLKADLLSPTFTGIVSGIDKTMVGLTNVDNTTDLSKPISTLTQAQLDLKAPINNPTFTGTISGIDKTMIGLTNVDNTTDLNKPISTATQTALNLKANLTTNTFTGKNIFSSQVDITTLSEKISVLPQPVTSISTCNYALNGVHHFTPANANAIGLDITNVPTTDTYKTYVISVLIDATTYKVKFTSVKVNSSVLTLLFEGDNSVSLTTASVIVQRFVIIYTSSATVPWKVISSVSTFT